MEKNYIVTKANKLITANYNLSLQEQKLILILASMVQPEDNEFKEYEFEIKKFMKLLNIETQTKYSEIPKITKGLMKKVFEIQENDDIVQLSWLSSARYKTGRGIVVLKFDSSLKPYLLQLKQFYTSYKLQNILSLKSKYSLRLFEILKSNQFKKSWEVELDELKKLLGANEKSYTVYQNVKNRIIIQAQKELKDKTDIAFEFEEIKTGRRVTVLKFHIYSNKINDATYSEVSITKADDTSVDTEVYINEDDKIFELYNLFKEYKISFESIKNILKSANGNINKVKDVFEYAKTQNIDNFVGYMIAMVKGNNFKEPKIVKRAKRANFTEREYDYNKLEKQLLGWDDPDDCEE